MGNTVFNSNSLGRLENEHCILQNDLINVNLSFVLCRIRLETTGLKKNPLILLTILNQSYNCNSKLIAYRTVVNSECFYIR